MDKDKFIIAFNNITNNIQVSDEDFNSIVSMLRIRGIIDNDFVIDENKSQLQNILNGVYADMLRFYKIYIGQ